MVGEVDEFEEHAPELGQSCTHYGSTVDHWTLFAYKESCVEGGMGKQIKVSKGVR